MKKEILNLLKSEQGTLKINEICYLNRWTKDTMGNEVDKLKLEFYTINNVNHSIYLTEIENRDYKGIINEVEMLNRVFLEELRDTLCKNIKNGYLG